MRWRSSSAEYLIGRIGTHELQIRTQRLPDFDVIECGPRRRQNREHREAIHFVGLQPLQKNPVRIQSLARAAS